MGVSAPDNFFLNIVTGNRLKIRQQWLSQVALGNKITMHVTYLYYPSISCTWTEYLGLSCATEIIKGTLRGMCV